MDNKIDACKEILKKTDTVLLSFSLGKDSVAAWVELKKYFKRIIPYYLYLIPDLSFVETSIRYYEEFFDSPILRLPHPSFYRMLKNMVFQPPERCNHIESFRFPQLSYDKINGWIREQNGLNEYSYCATGIRMADSPFRRMAINKHGPINHSKKTFYPIYDWNKEKLIDALKESKIRLPIDYAIFGRSFDGIDYRFIQPIKDNFPEDFKKILFWFPLADLEIKRREYAERSR